MSIKKGTIPPRYDETFKSGAVKMVTAQGRPSREVAAELGICNSKPSSFQFASHKILPCISCTYIVFHLHHLYFILS